MTNILSEVARKSNSALLIGLPRTDDDFAEVRDTSDFTKRFRSFEDYSESNRISLFSDAFSELTDMGFTIHWMATLDDLARVVMTKRFVSVVTHCKRGTHIEFAGRLVAFGECIELLPKDWTGLLDLCVCEPAMIKIYKDRFRDRARLQKHNRHLTFSIWLHHYFLLLRCIHEERLSNVPYKIFYSEFITNFSRD